MGFWICMLISSLIVPLSMIGFGYYFAKGAPEQINTVFGYRTARSMKNAETWEFAHLHCGKTWRVAGWILLPVSCLAMLLVLGKDENTVGIYGGWICCLQLIPLIASIIPTEIALKRTFDENGNRKTHT